MSSNLNILNALSDPKVFTGFDELLHSLPAHQTSSSKETASKAIANTLRLFSYGTFRDYYSAAPGTYINLNERQILKLKALTVVSAVHRNCYSNQCGIITYETLEAELGIMSSSVPNNNTDTNSHNSNDDEDNDHRKISSLEDILIHCIYANLLPSGTKLDQKNKCVIVKLSSHHPDSEFSTTNGTSHGTIDATSSSSHNVLCRDVDLNQDLPEMIQSLERFHLQGKQIQEYLSQIKSSTAQSTWEQNKQWKQIDVLLQTVQERIQYSSKEEGEKSVPVIMQESPQQGASALSSVMEWSKSSTNTSSSALPTRQVKRSRGGPSSM